MGELDRKQKGQADQARKRRADVDDQAGDKDGTQLLPWDADVDGFLSRLTTALKDFRVSMGSIEFRNLHLAYRELSAAERRSVSNRLQQRRLGNLLRALHAGDYRLYTDGWELEAKASRGPVEGPHTDEK